VWRQGTNVTSKRPGQQQAAAAAAAAAAGRVWQQQQQFTGKIIDVGNINTSSSSSSSSSRGSKSDITAAVTGAVTPLQQQLR